jgi:hypothetical protein
LTTTLGLAPGSSWARKRQSKASISQNETRDLPELQLKMEDIASHAIARAASCMDCQEEVQKALGQKWRPY